MNILPKKRWHVRTKENMARVRKDEKEAAEKEQRELERQITATNESRLTFMRGRADERMEKMYGVRKSEYVEEEGSEGIGQPEGHVNLFADLEREERKMFGSTNKEREEEKKKEQNEYEAKMGIKMALGGGSKELEKKGEWYELLPTRRDRDKEKAEEEKRRREAEQKESILKEQRSRGKRDSSSERSSSEESRKKKRKKLKKEKKKNKKRDREKEVREEEEAKKRRLAELRLERVRREREEAARVEALLNPRKREEEEKSKKPRYNSQFNPHLAR